MRAHSSQAASNRRLLAAQLLLAAQPPLLVVPSFAMNNPLTARACVLLAVLDSGDEDAQQWTALRVEDTDGREAG